MNILEQQTAKEEFSSIMNEIIQELEENRYEPSERGAGTAPTDDACTQAEYLVIEAIEKFKGIDLKKKYSFEDIMKEIVLLKGDGIEPKNHADDIDCLNEIDQTTEFLYEKRIQVDTIYEHKPTKRFMMVSVDLINDDHRVILDVRVSEVSKKEKITYEWSA